MKVTRIGQMNYRGHELVIVTLKDLQKFEKTLTPAVVSTKKEKKVNGFASTDSAPAKKKSKRQFDMRCRHQNGDSRCSNRSKGPRFQFLCAEHREM